MTETTDNTPSPEQAAYIMLTVGDFDNNGFVSLAATDLMHDDHARSLIADVDALVDPAAEPGDDASFAFILDLMRPNGDCEDTGKRRLPLQVAARLAPEAVSAWLSERPDPNTVMHRKPMALDIERLKEAA